MMQDLIKKSFTAAQDTLSNFAANKDNLNEIEQIALIIAEQYRKKNKVIIFGNGGSMCDAMHFAEELTGRFHKNREPLPAIAISDPSHITCVGNDYGYDEIFARAVSAYSQSGDVVIGLSTSGNSPNIIKALSRAQDLGCITIALLGADGGKLAGTTDYELIVPADTSDRIQEIHTIILHVIVEMVERELFSLPDPVEYYA
nr:D-sedoheptulose 7-phosphate isomerase [Candidatus Cloacimonadota bacterium]